ncbi:hypothetical protein [Bacteroides sp. 51]|uniref:hypothetical protein n=1 Tax=Bacteroides sp. 51 TaxID=2302938 RepID=UPI0013D101FB|nr:hypothetical protein [Bacteroides sp. 51]NDV83450.1 hypothetical protein [Bacteroides sp. 51]
MIEKDKNLVRVPRALSEYYNLDLIERLYETTGNNAAADLVIFLAGRQPKNLFGEVWFSVSDFCSEMGYDRTNMQRKLSPDQIAKAIGQKSPELLISGTNQEEIKHPIETVFEVALYKLGKENLTFPSNSNGKTTYNFVQIITKLDIITDTSTKKKTKRLYSVKLNDKIANTFFTSYNLLEPQDYKKIPDRAGYRYFYLNLSRMIFLIKYKITKGEAPYFTLSVDQLAKIFNINVEENKNRKRKIGEILNRINSILKTTKFEYEFIKGTGQKWAYTVQFFFPEETLNYFNESFKASFTTRFYDEMMKYYISNKLKAPMSSQIFEDVKTKEEENRRFIEWIHSTEDMEEKETAYRRNFQAIYGTTPEAMGFEKDKIIF